MAWTPPHDLAGRDVACLVDGRVRTRALAAELGLDLAGPAESLIAEGYRRLGEGVLERLGGEFALLVWSGGERRGLLARDRSAARPLFVAERAGALLFASEVRNLLALLPSRPAPDGEAMARWLARAGAPDGRTLFAGIRALPGGAALRLGGRTWEERRFWTPGYAAPRAIGRDQAASEMRAALGVAVEHALDGAGRPGVMLSGGLDSAAVAAAAVAAKGRPRPVAYSGVFPEHPEVDESGRIRVVRERLGLDGVEAAVGAGSALAAAVEFTRAWELPPVSPNRFLWEPLLRRAAADGVDVLLDGEGGDELFGCASYLVADRLLAGRVLAALSTARRLPGMGARPRPRWIARGLLVYGVRGALPPGLHRRLRAARGSGEGPDWLADPVEEPRWAWKARPGPRWWAQLSYVLTSDSLGAADHQRRDAALHGLELRHPLRDPELIDLVLGLPPELGFDPHLDRPLARAALQGELPEAVLTGTEKPFFNELPRRALAGPDRAALASLLDDPDPLLAARVRHDAVRRLLDGASATPPPPGWAQELWRLATLEIWLERQADPAAGDRLLERLESDPPVAIRTVPA